MIRSLLFCAALLAIACAHSQGAVQAKELLSRDPALVKTQLHIGCNAHDQVKTTPCPMASKLPLSRGNRSGLAQWLCWKITDPLGTSPSMATSNVASPISAKHPYRPLPKTDTSWRNT